MATSDRRRESGPQSQRMARWYRRESSGRRSSVFASWSGPSARRRWRWRFSTPRATRSKNAALVRRVQAMTGRKRAVMCRVLGIGRATSYREERPRGRRYAKADERVVTAQIREVVRTRATYGSRRVRALVNRAFTTSCPCSIAMLCVQQRPADDPPISDGADREARTTEASRDCHRASKRSDIGARASRMHQISAPRLPFAPCGCSRSVGLRRPLSTPSAFRVVG